MSVDSPAALERLIHRDRLLVGLALAGITALAWVYLLRMAVGMRAAVLEADMHAAMGMSSTPGWGLAELFALFSMWSIMMVAMMLPSAAPVILLVVGTYRRRSGSPPHALTASFGAGYVVAWAGFSAAAALFQTFLHQSALLSAGMVSRSTLFGGAVLLVAGVYQWLPIKNACLSHCRSPLGFLTHEWREGPGGAFIMGCRHGLFCVGCCWALMTLLFVAGVMNLLWVAAIAAFVLIEKIAPQGLRVGRATGLLLVFWGLYILGSAV